MFVTAAVIGASLLTPDAAQARRCGRHHRNRGRCGTSYCSPCGGAANCGYGCGSGAAAPAPAMSGPPPAPADESAPPPPAPTPGT
jgi:hypothetical protein